MTNFRANPSPPPPVLTFRVSPNHRAHTSSFRSYTISDEKFHFLPENFCAKQDTSPITKILTSSRLKVNRHLSYLSSEYVLHLAILYREWLLVLVFYEKLKYNYLLSSGILWNTPEIILLRSLQY